MYLCQGLRVVLILVCCTSVYGDSDYKYCGDCVRFMENLNSLDRSFFEDQFLLLPLKRFIPYNLSSGNICSFLEVCPQTAPYQHEVKDFILNTAFPQQVNDVMASEECEYCEPAVAAISSVLQANERELIATVEVDALCDDITFQNYPQCNGLLSLYFNRVFDLVVEYLQQNNFCSQLSYCPITSKVSTQEDEFEECLYCQQVESAISTLLGSEHSRQILGANLSVVCGFSQECTSILNLYVDQIIQVLLENLQGDELCTEMKICPQYQFSVQIPNKLFLQTILPHDECQYCKKATGGVLSFFQNEQTKNIVQHNLVDSLDPYSVLTTILGDILVDTVLQSLLKFIFEHEFCTELGYCSTNEMNVGESFISVN